MIKSEYLSMTVKSACKSLLVAHYHHDPERKLELRGVLTLAQAKLREQVARLKRARSVALAGRITACVQDVAMIDNALNRTRA